MRDVSRRGKLEEAAGSTMGDTLSVLPLDVTSDQSVAACFDAIPNHRVDVLINNAGVGLSGPLEGLSMDRIQNVFETNVLGAVRVIRSVLPHMKQRRSGHVIVMSSVMGLQGVVFNDIYAASKFAVEGLCESLAVQLIPFNVHVTLVEPGPVHTDLEIKLLEDTARCEFPDVDSETLRLYREVYVPASQEVFEALGQSPEDVAQAVMKVITEACPPLRYQTNPLYTPLTALKFADKSGNFSVRTLKRLLFDYGRLFHFSLALLKLLRCSCCSRSRAALL
uniref:Retinol dehydrogenase 8a n=1 Tax=Eptatretus burgeri TaxID=7764 RepID=A0A8C4NFY4_EPTBU